MKKLLFSVALALVCATGIGAESRAQFLLRQEYLRVLKEFNDEKQRHENMLLEVMQYELQNSNILVQIKMDSERLLTYSIEAKKSAVAAFLDARDERDDLTNQVTILETKVAGQTNRIAKLEAKRDEMTNRLAAAWVKSHNLSNELSAANMELTPLEREKGNVEEDSEFLAFIEKVMAEQKFWLHYLLNNPVPGIPDIRR